MKTKYRIRKKGLRADGSIRYSVEKILRGKVSAITLPKAKKLFEILCLGKLKKNGEADVRL